MTSALTQNKRLLAYTVEGVSHQPLGPRQQALYDDLMTPGLHQAQRYLTTNYGDEPEADCCLGRACKLAMKQGLKVNARPNQLSPWVMQYDEEKCVLPFRVLEFFGFCSQTGGLEEDFALSSLNDAGRTFPEIAEIIKAKAHLLFTEPM